MGNGETEQRQREEAERLAREERERLEREQREREAEMNQGKKWERSGELVVDTGREKGIGLWGVLRAPLPLPASQEDP
eukprot:1774420-Pyramimonas_sp.AAC.1